MLSMNEDEAELVKIWVKVGDLRPDEILIAPTANIDRLRGKIKAKFELDDVDSAALNVKLGRNDAESLKPVLQLQKLLKNYADKLERKEEDGNPILYVDEPERPGTLDLLRLFREIPQSGITDGFFGQIYLLFSKVRRVHTSLDDAAMAGWGFCVPNIDAFKKDLQLRASLIVEKDVLVAAMQNAGSTMSESKVTNPEILQPRLQETLRALLRTQVLGLFPTSSSSSSSSSPSPASFSSSSPSAAPAPVPVVVTNPFENIAIACPPSNRNKRKHGSQETTTPSSNPRIGWEVSDHPLLSHARVVQRPAVVLVHRKWNQLDIQPPNLNEMLSALEIKLRFDDPSGCIRRIHVAHGRIFFLAAYLAAKSASAAKTCRVFAIASESKVQLVWACFSGPKGQRNCTFFLGPVTEYGKLGLEMLHYWLQKSSALVPGDCSAKAEDQTSGGGAGNNGQGGAAGKDGGTGKESVGEDGRGANDGVASKYFEISRERQILAVGEAPDRFLVDRPLGSGEFGSSVFLGLHALSKCPAVLKFRTLTHASSLANECDTLLALDNCPSIVRALGFFSSVKYELCCLILLHVPGSSVRQYVCGLDLEQRKTYLANLWPLLVRPLLEPHRKGIFHGNVNLEHYLIEENGSSEPALTLIGWGAANSTSPTPPFFVTPGFEGDMQSLALSVLDTLEFDPFPLDTDDTKVSAELSRLVSEDSFAVRLNRSVGTDFAAILLPILKGSKKLSLRRDPCWC